MHAWTAALVLASLTFGGQPSNDQRDVQQMFLNAARINSLLARDEQRDCYATEFELACRHKSGWLTINVTREYVRNDSVHPCLFRYDFYPEGRVAQHLVIGCYGMSHDPPVESVRADMMRTVRALAPKIEADAERLQQAQQ